MSILSFVIKRLQLQSLFTDSTTDSFKNKNPNYFERNTENIEVLSPGSVRPCRFNLKVGPLADKPLTIFIYLHLPSFSTTAFYQHRDIYRVINAQVIPALWIGRYNFIRFRNLSLTRLNRVWLCSVVVIALATTRRVVCASFWIVECKNF